MLNIIMKSRPRLGVGLVVGGLVAGHVIRPLVFKALFPNGPGSYDSYDALQTAFDTLGIYDLVARWAFRIGVVVLAIWLKNKISPEGANSKAQGFGEPVAPKTLAEAFPSFTVPQNTIRFFKGDLYYVTERGTIISLKKWHFDANTGEFYRITDHDKEIKVWETVGYTKRLVARLKGKRLVQTQGTICALGAILVWAVMTQGRWIANTAGPGIPIGLAVFGFGFLVLPPLQFLKIYTANRVSGGMIFSDVALGPPPLKRKTDDFGPSTATAPPSHPAQDDLTYKPTSDGLGYTPST